MTDEAQSQRHQALDHALSLLAQAPVQDEAPFEERLESTYRTLLRLIEHRETGRWPAQQP